MNELQLLRTKTIEVKGLFGRYHHVVSLKLESGVTILHGPNGVGKTVVLRMVDALLRGEHSRIGKVPFESFFVEFTDGSRLGVINGEHPHIELFRPGTSRLSDKLPQDGKGPLWLSEFRDQVRCHLIEAQRLLRFDSHHEGSFLKPHVIHRVDDCARHLGKFIRTIMALYGRTSQALDQSYPQRVLSRKDRSFSGLELKQRLLELDAKQFLLMDLGLLDRTAAHPFDPAALDHAEAKELLALSLYVHDMAEKLSVLDYLARRIKLLLDHVNAKFRHKRLRIDREKGFIAENDRGQLLELDALSSGEQHELVLHYDLLFMVAPNTLVMIDEPERSLYVSWQKRFLPDLLEIVKITGLDVLFTTHSPYLVGEREELMVALADAG